MLSFTTVANTVARKVTRFTTVAETVAKETIGLAHVHFAPSDDSCVFVRTDSAPLSDPYGVVYTGRNRSIDHAAILLFYTGLLSYNQSVAVPNSGWIKDACLHVFLYTAPSKPRGRNHILHTFINHNAGLRTRGCDNGIP